MSVNHFSRLFGITHLLLLPHAAAHQGLNIAMDSLIALAYAVTAVVLLRLIRRRKDIPHRLLVQGFCAFLLACTLVRVFDMVSLWEASARLGNSMRVITAAISVTALLVLLRLAPAIEALPTAMHLDRVHQQLSSVLESMTASVFAVDAAWKIIYMNSNARRSLNIEQNVIGQTMFDVFPDQLPETLEKLHEVMTTRRTVEFESFYEPLDLSTQVSASPWINGGMTVFFNDISEQRKLERALDKERDLRERRIEALAHMAGGLAHEISNPLGIIHARASDLAELLHDGTTPDPARITKACHSIVKTSDRAMLILAGLRLFARDGRTDPLETVSIASVVEQTVDLVRQRYATHGISLMVDAAPADLSITCRKVQIGQILLNLLNNAFDATHALAMEQRWVRLVLSASADQASVEVIDGGAGIPSEHRVHLMQPFFTTKAVGEGIGVGLSLSQAIAHDHGGSLLLVGNEPTCFRLTLARSAEPEAGIKPQLPECVAA